MSIVAIIPARYASTRLPGKPLLAETGMPLIRHVVEAAGRSKRIDRVIVATDDDRIAEAVRAFGGEVAMTREDHPSGTDRVAEVAEGLVGVELVVNLQGDEPEASGALLDDLVDLMRRDPGAAMGTLATPIIEESIYLDPSCVKVVIAAGRALYFSRSPIPFHRDGVAEDHYGYLHIGVYAYRPDFLKRLAAMPTSPLERAEKLEQLRVLEAGYPIAIGVVEEPSVGIDTPEDYRRFVSRWRSRR